jgi:hypothetical protein
VRRHSDAGHPISVVLLEQRKKKHLRKRHLRNDNDRYLHKYKARGSLPGGWCFKSKFV